jgi:N-acetylglucosamine kinase-like BadF-type ATPase
MQMKQYVIGVDGGNTKTDYFLYDVEGNFVDAIRSGSCSHEALKDSFQGSFRVMNEELTKLLGRNGLKPQDITASAYGLAGVDVPHQKKALEEIVEKMGFHNFVVANDGFLGIKAGTSTGIGACSINGTGTVSVGIDDLGHYIQVGGIGVVSGDESGGAFLARRVVQAAYNETYRFGNHTSLTKAVYDLLEIENKQDFSNKVSLKFAAGKVDRTTLVKMLFEHANNGDQVSIRILEEAGEQMARSTAGCISELVIDGAVEVVLAGSVWAKATANHMFESFKKWINTLTNRTCTFHILDAPPAIGAVIWAIELALRHNPSPEIKEKILMSIEQYQNQY